MPKQIIRVGSRESPLAVVQARMVMDAIRKAHPEADVRLCTMKTSGDKLAEASLSQAGGKGLFVKELDRALAAGEVDFTVHSFKDLPMEQPDGLPVVCVSPRADARDALVLPAGVRDTAAGELSPERPIGCSSRRRACQLGALFPGVPVAPVRGNVQTRLRKLDAGGFSALVLAAAGLARAGLSGRVSRLFTVDEMMPAACQGILAVQARAGEDCSCLDAFRDADAWDASQAERAFVRAFGGGCGTPVAAYAEINGAELRLRGLFLHEPSGRILRGSRFGLRTQAVRLGEALAKELSEKA